MIARAPPPPHELVADRHAPQLARQIDHDVAADAKKRGHDCTLPSSANKKADVVGHPKVIDHVGLLVNEPPGTAELLFI